MTTGARAGRAARAEAAIALFAKAPRPGLVKTRLVPPLTGEEAARIARAALEDTARHVVPAVDARWTLYLDGAADDTLRVLAEECGLTIAPQRGADLGERLAAAFEDMRGQGRERVLAIGSDSPTLDPGRVRDAIEALSASDVVLGPAEDGGYYLVGMKGRHEAIFEGIPWSTDAVAARTLERAGALGLTVRLLPPWYDLDDAASLLRSYEDCSGDGPAWAIRALVDELRTKLDSG